MGGALLTSLLQNPPAKIKDVVATANFSYVATAVAGLVLTAATGAIGTAPVQLAAQGSGPASVAQQQQPSATPLPPVADPQRKAFQIICAWSYVGLGILCTMVFVISAKPHELVKTIGLTTLGFATTIIGSLSAE